MPSLAILEGLIGTACAVTCLYYARLGALAAPQNPVQTMVPWHSALGEYARRNPFAVVFGALAFGFLVSSWSMYALPRPMGVESRAIEKWHTVTKNVPIADPAQAAKIAALQNTINADTATIAGQNAQIDGLKQSLAKFTTRRGARSSAIPAGTKGTTEEGTAATLNKSFNTTGAAAETPATTSAPPPAATQNTTPAPPNETPTQNNTAATPQNPPASPPH